MLGFRILFKLFLTFQPAKVSRLHALRHTSAKILLNFLCWMMRIQNTPHKDMHYVIYCN